MSISSLLNQKNDLRDKRFLNKLKIVQNQFDLLKEETARAETFKSQLKLLDEYDEKMNDLISFPNDLSNVYTTHFSSIKNRIDFITNDIVLLYEIINNKFSQYNSFKEDYLNSTISMRKRIYQKLASASFSPINFTKTFVENFSNLENIDNTKTTCYVDTNNELLTLPISKRTINEINNIIILQTSNGLSGSITDNKNGNLFYTIDGKEDTVFEYSKLDEGPCLLNLKYTMRDSNVLNEISMKTNLINGVSKFKIDNIIFEDEIGTVISIFELLNVNEQKMIVNFYESYTSSGFVIKFLPIKCKHVTFMLSQNEYIDVTTNQNYKTSIRKMFAIVISEIQLITNEYKESGELISKNLSIADSMFMGAAILNVFPKNGQYYKSQIFIDDNKGLGNVELFDNTGSYISDGLGLFNYKLVLQKLQTIDQEIVESKEDTLVKFLNTYKTIISVNDYVKINDTFIKESLIVGRSDFLIRSNDKKIKTLATVASSSWMETDQAWVVNLNVNLKRISSAGLFIESPSNATYQFKDDSTLQVVLNKTNWPSKPSTFLSIKWWAQPYKPVIYEKSNRYYIFINEPFEPNKQKIKLKNKSQLQYKEETINKNSNNVFKLSNGNVNTNFKIVGLTSSDYTINTLDGTIILKDNNINKIDVEYFYSVYSDLNINDYDFWFIEKTLKGISIEKSKVVSSEIVESLKDTNSKTKFSLRAKGNMIVDSVKFNEKLFNNEKYSIINYIDGKKEFSNLLKMTNDSIPDQEIDQEYPFIAFRLAKEIFIETSKLINSDLILPSQDNVCYKVIVNDNENPTALSGYICTTDAIRDKLVQLAFTLSLITDGYSSAFYSLESNIGMFVAKKDDMVLKNCFLNYSYLDVSKNESNLISIDYENSIIYSNKEINNAAEVKVTYRTLPLELEYSIYDPVNFDYSDGKIQYNAESKTQYQQSNNQLAIYYAKEVNNLNIEENLNYFSPLIYSVKLGFN